MRLGTIMPAQSKKRVLHGAGEYEIGGVFITGVQTAAAKGKAAASRADGNTEIGRAHV